MPDLTLSEIARRLGGRLVGADKRVRAVKPLEEAESEDLSFLSHPRYRPLLEMCRAGGLLVAPGVRAEHLSLVVVERPYVALAKVMGFLHPPVRPVAGVDPRSVVPEDCQLGREVCIGPFVTLGRGCCVGDRTILQPGVTLGEEVRVGQDCLLYPGVTVLDRCTVGSRVILHAGAVVGSDGFGFAEEGGAHLKIPQIGNVIVEDDVELGATHHLDRFVAPATCSDVVSLDLQNARATFSERAVVIDDEYAHACPKLTGHRALVVYENSWVGLAVSCYV